VFGPLVILVVIRDDMIDYVIGLGVMNHLVKLVEMDQTIPTRRNGKCETIHVLSKHLIRLYL